ncbi:hypothetical protein H4R35_000003 [Dimargaris xerosporica]|nr:hypothetical protein H4R35_000003 [Dimargaris xerosporica]
MGFNLLDQLAFYGVYHRNPVNVAVHIVFVPAIYWSFMVLLSLYGPVVGGAVEQQAWWAVPAAMGFQFDVSFLVTAFNFLFYLYIDPVGAALFAPFHFGLCLAGTWFAHHQPQALPIALAVNVVSWLAQFYSHAVHEKRAPALLDNLVQALVMAPFFVFLETVFMLGFRPRLHRDVTKHVQRKLAQLHANPTRAKKSH